jgi:uncharacterized membrane protein
MATLTVFRFENENGADQAVLAIEKLRKRALVQIPDTATVTWRVGRKPKTKHLSHLAGRGALDGAFWGTLFGMIFFEPFFSMAIGEAVDAVSAKFKEYGINEDFIKSVRERVTEGTSAVFFLSGDGVLNKIIDAAKSLPKFEVILSNLTNNEEAALRTAFTREPAATARGVSG